MKIADPFWFGVAREIGLENRFETLPISLGADWRPVLSIVEETNFHAGGFEFNIRYRFGEYTINFGIAWSDSILL